MADIAYRQKVNDLNARARKYDAKGALNADDLRAVFEFFGGVCLVPDCGRTDVQFDHVIPLEKQGPNDRSNLQLLCESHNKAKSEIDYRNGRICPDDYVAKTSEYQDKSIDWKAIRTRYVSSEIALRELAREEQVSESSIFKRAAREHWNESREQYRSKVEADVSASLAAKEVDARLIAADTARAVIDSWLCSVKEEASANDALNAAKLLLLLNGEPTSRTATVNETDVDDADFVRAAEQIARRAERRGTTEVYYQDSDAQEGMGAGWSD